MRPGRRSPNPNARSPYQREQDLVLLADLLNRFPSDSINRIAERFNALPSRRELGALNRATIQRDVHTLMERWRSQQDVERYRTLVTQQILYAQTEFMEAWQRSKTPREVSTTRRVTGGAHASDTPATTVELRTEQSWGDPNFLAGYLRCAERLTKLWGIEPAVRSRLDIRLIQEEVSAVARELGVPAEELMHQVEAIVTQRWNESAGAGGQTPLATALALDLDDEGAADEEDDLDV